MWLGTLTDGPSIHGTHRRSRASGPRATLSKNSGCHVTGFERNNRQDKPSLGLNRNFDLKIVMKLTIHMPKQMRSQS